MKLVFIKDNKVVNVAIPPKENLEEYKNLIYERGFGHTKQQVDLIIPEEDGVLVQNGWILGDKGYVGLEKSEEQLLADKDSLIEAKLALEEEINDIDVKINGKH